MLGQFTRQDQSNGRLDFSGRHGRLLVVSGQFRGFSRDLFEDVVDEGVHDAHRLGGDAGVRVHLLQDLVDVDLVGFGLGLASNLLGARGLLLRGFLGHRVRAFASWNGARPGRATATGDFSRNRLIVSGSRV